MAILVSLSQLIFVIFLYYTFHARSHQGPECETIEVGVVNGKTVVFVGVDRASVIAIYTVSADGQATYESLHRRGGVNSTFAELLENRDLGDLDPKDME